MKSKKIFFIFFLSAIFFYSYVFSKEIKLAAIGGSITQGIGASSSDKKYLNLVSYGLKKIYPNLEIEMINAGLGGTGSDIGLCRIKNDILIHYPHIVIIEFSVNDTGKITADRTYEGLLRAILNLNPRPLVVGVLLTNRRLQSAKDRHMPLLQHYDLSIVDVGSALVNKLSSWEIPLYFNDQVHPNDRGHEFIAQEILNTLSQNIYPNDSLIPDPIFFPPLTESLLITPQTAENFLDKNIGWKAINKNNQFPNSWWEPYLPNAILEFNVPCTCIGVVYRREAQGLGNATLIINDKILNLNGNFPQCWEGGWDFSEIVECNIDKKYTILKIFGPNKKNDLTYKNFKLQGILCMGINNNSRKIK